MPPAGASCPHAPLLLSAPPGSALAGTVVPAPCLRVLTSRPIAQSSFKNINFCSCVRTEGPPSAGSEPRAHPARTNEETTWPVFTTTSSSPRPGVRTRLPARDRNGQCPVQLVTMNVQPLHRTPISRRADEFGKPLVNSLFTLGLLIGMTVNDTTLGTTIANLGMTDVAFPKRLRRRYAACAHPRRVDARQQITARCGHLVNRAHSAEPSRRNGCRLQARRADAQASRPGAVMTRSLLFVPGDSGRNSITPPPPPPTP